MPSPALNRGMGIDLVTISYVKAALEVTTNLKRIRKNMLFFVKRRVRLSYVIKAFILIVDGQPHLAVFGDHFFSKPFKRAS